MGIYDGNIIENVGKVLLNLGFERVMVVYGDDGLDEIIIIISISVCEINDGKVKLYKLNLGELGIEKVKLEDI